MLNLIRPCLIFLLIFGITLWAHDDMSDLSYQKMMIDGYEESYDVKLTPK